MKNIICIVALLSIVYASEQNMTDSFYYLERLVNIQKSITKAVLNDVLLFEKQIKQNLEVRLNDLETQALFEVNNIINSTFENINLSIEEGKKENKKIDECYDYAKHNLETKKYNTIVELEICIQNGNAIMEAPLMNLAKNIKAIKTLLIELDVIIPNCHSWNFIKMQHCITMNLFMIKSSLKNISSNTITVTNIAISAHKNMIRDVKNSTMKLVVDIRIFSTGIIVRINSCIRNAPADNPKSTNNTNLSPCINSSSRNF